MKAAMTPQQWEDGKVILKPAQKYDEGVGFEFYTENEDCLNVYNGSWAVDVPTELRHQIAAAVLRNQPFGFTREDVEFLRGFVTDQRQCDPFGFEAYKDEYVALMDSLADRIEALLPPEKT
jgi:hypothetical protein